jgi:exonuclease III
MKLSLITFNVRGLNDPVSIPKLKHYFSTSPQVDIILLQEHKLRLQAAQDLGPKLWKRAAAWILDASPGYGHLPHLPGVSKGGICTLVHPRLKHMVTHIGNVMGNRAHWLVLGNLPGGHIGIVHIYTPNDSRSRCLLWEQMMIELPTTCRWILVGDLNMVEHCQDKTNPLYRNGSFSLHSNDTLESRTIPGPQVVSCIPMTTYAMMEPESLHG